MEAEEKAKKLVDDMYCEMHNLCITDEVLNEVAKQCALIAVDEIIKETPKLIPDETYIDDVCGVDYFINEMYEYWINVKNEINKL